MMNNTLTDVPGIRVGHITDLEGATGCTVILCPDGTVGGVDQRGGAPGTRETDLLRPMHLVNHVNAVVLSGGSAFGLAAADGAMRWLEEHGIGYKSASGFLVPIVPAAILMDLAIGKVGVRPDAAMGYAACEVASDAPVAQGCVGAGTGCRIGAMRGNEFATKGGLGSASVELSEGIIVAALIAVNCVGDVLDEHGSIIAGLRQPPDGRTFSNMMSVMKTIARQEIPPPRSDSNTVIGVVATNGKLTKEQVNKVAQMAHDGLAQAVRPAHTMWDGDTLFALATGEKTANVTAIGAYAAEMVAQAIRSAVRAATTLAGVRALND
jgi:L-aminopeptidase/D-esterase-like protein